MRFSDDLLNEIRDRLPVSEVVRRKVPLKKHGREWRGLSPFNKEKTPSFFVNDQKGFYHDFSSGKHGDIFGFVIETEGLSFPEAVEQLARLAGVPLPTQSREADAYERKRKSLHDVLELAAKFFEQSLASSRGAKARGYLADRGITPTTQLEFRMGYAPGGRYTLKEHLGAQGVSVSDMIEVGLLIAADDIPVPYDRFRDRVMIPIQDQRGRIVGFGGRVLDPEAQPKYLNSPETSLFHKGSTVFNFHRARQAAHDDGSVVVVEGYMDAISVYQAGMKSVVATMGTAFTEEQIDSLWRLSPEPIVCFDSDRAGIAAAQKSVDRILPMLKVGRTFKFSFIQGGKDPDELIREKGLDAFKETLLGSQSLWDVLWERETQSSSSNARFDTPDARAALEHRMYAILRTIKDKDVHTAYHRTCRIELSDLFWQVTKAHRGDREPYKAKPNGLLKNKIKIEKEGYKHGLKKILLGMFVQFPEFLDEKSEAFERVQLDERLEQLRAGLYLLLIECGALDVALIYERLGDRFHEILDEVHGDRTETRPRGHRLFAMFPILLCDPPHDFISKCLDHFIHVLHIEQMVDDLARAQQELKINDTDAVMERIVALKKDIQVHVVERDVTDIALDDDAAQLRRLGKRFKMTLPVKELARESA